jgi:hypothetical protein
VLFGLVLALNRRDPFLPLAVTDLLRAHAHLGLVGFFLTLLQGATFQLVPMFTMADLCRPGFVRAGLVLAQLGLFVLTPGLAFGQDALAIGGALVLAAGVGCSAYALAATLRSRRRRVLEPGIRAFMVGAIILGLGVAGGLLLVAWPTVSSSQESYAAAYGVALIPGALSFMILGMLCKIVPFLVWMKVYGPRAGRQPVPLATALGSRSFESSWLALHLAAVIVLITGHLAAGPGVVSLGAIMLATAVVAYLANIGRVLAHLVQSPVGFPSTPPR